MELYLPGLVKKCSQISVSGCLYNTVLLIKKSVYLEKKQLVKKFSIRKTYF